MYFDSERVGSLGGFVRTGGLRVSVTFTECSRYEILAMHSDLVNVCGV